MPSFTFDSSIPKPDWELWSRRTRACLWEAVAISLDIEPGDSANSVALGTHKMEYTRRLRLSSDGLGTALTVIEPPGKTDNRDPAHAVINLMEFASLARKMDWQLPPRFPMDSVDWEHWSRADTSEVWMAVAVALRISPDQHTFERAMGEFSEAFRSMLRTAVNGMESGTLEVEREFEWPMRNMSNRDLSEDGRDPDPPKERNTVRLDKFATWATNKRYVLPTQFPRETVAASPESKKPSESREEDTKPVSVPLDTRERNKLLTMVAAMAKAAYVKDVLEQAADDIVNDAKEIGLKLDRRTAAKYLKEAAALIADKGTKGE